MRNIGVETRGYKPVFNMTLTDGDNHSYTITDHDVQADSLAIRTGTSNTGELTIGAAVIGSLSVGLLNDGSNNNKYNNVNWRGAYIEATFTVNGANVQLGRYYVNEHSEQGGAIRVVAYDAMQILDGYQIYEHQFTYPLDAVTAVNTIATALGRRTQQQWQVVGLSGVTLSLPDPGTDKMSERAFLSYVAQILCKYVVVKRMNGIDTIFFGWYDTAHPVRNAGTTFSHDIKTSDYNPENFQIKVYDSSYTVTVRGTGGTGPLTNAVYIENNPFIRSSNVGLPNPGGGIAYDIYTQVHALTYRPGTVDILADIALEAGDVINVSTGPLGGTYKMIITNLTFGTGLTMSVTSDADPSDDMIFNPSTYFKKATQQAISDELADADSELSQAIGGGSGSDYVLVELPATTCIAQVDSNDEPYFGRYDGLTLEFQCNNDNGWQGTPLYTYRNRHKPGSKTATPLGGIEIASVYVPAQTIKIPVGGGNVDLLVRVSAPTDEMWTASGLSKEDHMCGFLTTVTTLRVPVGLAKMNGRWQLDAGGKYTLYEFGSPYNYEYNFTGNDVRIRNLVRYDGLVIDPFRQISLANGILYRIPRCDIPLPGKYFFPEDTTASISHKWCYPKYVGSVRQVIQVPSKYISYGAT